MKHTGLPVTWCLAAAAMFGASTPAAKAIIGDVGPVTLAGLVYLGGALAVLPFSFKGGSRELRKKPIQLKWMAGVVVFGGILGPIFLMLGLQQAPAASVSLWLNLETVATSILAWAFFKEHIDRQTVLAAALIVIAGAVLSTPGGFATLPAATLVALACVCWGFDNNFTAIIDGYTPAQMTLVKGVIGGAFNLIVGYFLNESIPNTQVLLWGLVIGAFGYGFSIVLYIAGAQQLGASRSQMIFSSAPFLGVGVSWILLREQILGVQVAAAAIMIIGTVILLTTRHEHSHFHEASEHTHSHRHDDDHHDGHHGAEDLGLLPGVQHTHPHKHDGCDHNHPHMPDLHHRHDH